MTAPYSESISAAVRELEVAKSTLIDEIRHYPTPISGCDAQFNHLLAQRTQVDNALSALRQPVFVATPRRLHALSGVESR